MCLHCNFMSLPQLKLHFMSLLLWHSSANYYALFYEIASQLTSPLHLNFHGIYTRIIVTFKLQIIISLHRNFAS
jgi:hypothetical protein